jgi:hypothetical protein
MTRIFEVIDCIHCPESGWMDMELFCWREKPERSICDFGEDEDTPIPDWCPLPEVPWDWEDSEGGTR